MVKGRFLTIFMSAFAAASTVFLVSCGKVSGGLKGKNSDSTSAQADIYLSKKGEQMNFETYLKQAWQDHGTDAQKVADQFVTGIDLIEKNEQIPQLAQLMTHVFGEHLGQWEKGIETLDLLKKLSHFQKETESDHAVKRSIAILEVASGNEDALKNFSSVDQVRVLATAASALTGTNIEKAQSLFRHALETSDVAKFEKESPAHRSLAVIGNNLACALEEKPTRSPQEKDLMILAAHTGRKYWEMAGTFVEVAFAEYRLAMSYLKAEDLAQAIKHAQTCVEICQSNNAGAYDMFYGFEALAQIERARGNKIGQTKATEEAQLCFEKMSDDDKKWARKSMEQLLR